MGFSRQYQQRIRLSSHALAIIENDCLLFGCFRRDSHEPSIGSFINTVFCNSYENAEASIERRMAEKKGELAKLRSGLTSRDIQAFSERILNKEREQLEGKINALLAAECPANKECNPISLNKKTMEILEASDEERFYCDRTSRYIRAVMEEYASFDTLKRERIYFKKNIDTLTECISSLQVFKNSATKT